MRSESPLVMWLRVEAVDEVAVIVGMVMVVMLLWRWRYDRFSIFIFRACSEKKKNLQRFLAGKSCYNEQ